MSLPRYELDGGYCGNPNGDWCKWSDVAILLTLMKELGDSISSWKKFHSKLREILGSKWNVIDVTLEETKKLVAERDQLRSQVSALTAASFDWKHQLEHDFKANPHWLKKKIVEAAKLYLDTYQTPVHPAAKQEVDFMVALNELLK